MKKIKNKINKNKFNLIASFFVLFTPIIASAQSGLCGPVKYTKSLQWYLCEVYKIIGSYLIPILTLAATAYFIWGIVMFIKNANNDKLRGEYKTQMIWGIVALFVMVSVWGIIGILGGIVGTNTATIPQIRYK